MVSLILGLGNVFVNFVSVFPGLFKEVRSILLYFLKCSFLFLFLSVSNSSKIGIVFEMYCRIHSEII